MKRIYLIILTLYCLLGRGLQGFVQAKELSDTDMPLENILSHGTLNESGIIRAFLSLVIVIALIYITAWFYRKLGAFNKTKLNNETELDLNKFKLISTQPLGANKNLHVVEINGKYLVIGSTPNSINLIKEFDKNVQGECETFEKDDFVSEILDKYKNDEEV